MNVNMPQLRIVYCIMEVHFLSSGSKRRPWEVCPSDREQVAVPVMAPDFATKVQGKNSTNSDGFTMSILYRWKRLEVYFHDEFHFIIGVASHMLICDETLVFVTDWILLCDEWHLVIELIFNL